MTFYEEVNENYLIKNLFSTYDNNNKLLTVQYKLIDKQHDKTFNVYVHFSNGVIDEASIKLGNDVGFGFSLEIPND